MSKKIIKIDEEKCIGCGICASTCQQSAIEMVDGKARVVRDSSCDGIGNCLPVCPVEAISFSDVDVVENKKEEERVPRVCPGKNVVMLKNDKESGVSADIEVTSALRQWPVQIKLVPENAPYFDNANLLIAADCAAYAYANFHNKFMKNKITIIGCPKLDEIDYTEKLTAIISKNNIKSLAVVRMEVPCCGGIENAAINALKASGKFIPWQIVTISVDGNILDD